MRKRFLCLIMLLCCTLVLSGCGAINYSLLIFEDGSVQQAYIVTFDEQQISNAGYSVTDVKQKLENTASQVINNFKSNFSDRIDLTNEVKASVLSKIEYIFNKSTAGKVIIALKFETISVYKYFYGYSLENEQSEEMENDNTESNWFYSKTINTTETIFKDLQDNNIAKQWLSYFSAQSAQYGLDDMSYSFSYGTPYEHLYSDADQITESDGIKIHTWNFTSEELNTNVSTYTISFKPFAWYILALVIVFIAGAVMFCVDAIIKKKKIKKVAVTIDETVD